MLSRRWRWGQASVHFRFIWAPLPGSASQPEEAGLPGQVKVSAEGADGAMPEDEAEALSVLVGALYDAAIDHSLWPGALGVASTFMRSFASAIYEWSTTGSSRGFIYDDGKLEPSFKALYYNHYARVDPVATEHRAAALGEPFSALDVIPLDRYRRTRFYREWSRPQGIVDLLAAPIERTPSSAVLFGVVRHEREGMADDAMRRRMRLVTPHVRRAALVSGLLDSSTAHATELEEVIDGLGAGLFLVDAEGRVLHANDAAQAALKERNAVTVRDGKLAVLDPAAAQPLSDALTSTGEGPGRIGARRLSVPIGGRDGNYFAAHVLPLGGHSQSGTHAAAAVFVHPATLNTPLSPDLVGQAYGLTPAERRVLAHIVEAGSIAEAAERLRLSEATVKTHLQRIFAKTGTGRQTELVRLLAGFAGPLGR